MINIMLEVQNSRLFGRMETHSFKSTMYCPMLFDLCDMYTIDQKYGCKQVLSEASYAFLQLDNHQ